MPLSSLSGALSRIAGAFSIKNSPPGGLAPAGLGDVVGGAYLDRARKQRQPTRVELLAEFRNAVFCCVNLNSDGVAGTPLRLFVQTRSGDPRPKCKVKALTKKQDMRLRAASAATGRIGGDVEIEEVTEHRWIDLMRSPNPWMGWHFISKLTSQYCDIEGNTYWWIGGRDPLGVPTEIWPLPSHLVQPYRNPLNSNSRDIIEYYLFTSYKTQYQIPPKDIIHFRMFNPWDPYTSGMSPLRAVFEFVNTTEKMLGHTQAALDNQARPDALVSPAEVIGGAEATRLEQKLNLKFRAAGYGGILVAESGMKVDPLQWSPADLQALEVFAVTKDVIYDAYGVPQALATKETNLANLQASLVQHGRFGIRPRCHLRDEVINRQVMPRYDETDRLFVASDNPVPEDDTFEHTQRKDMVSLGGMTLGEWRSAAGLDKAEWADVPRVPSGLQPVDETTGEPIQQEMGFGGSGGDASGSSAGGFNGGDKPKGDKPKEPDKAAGKEEKSLLADVMTLNESVRNGTLRRHAACFLLCKTHGISSDEAAELIERPPKPYELAREAIVRSKAARSKVIDVRLVSVAHMRQTTDYTCGSVAFATVLGHLGIHTDEMSAAEELGTTYEAGTPPAAILAACERRGINCDVAHEMSIEDLKGMTSSGRPVLCPIQQYGKGEEYERDESGHWVVVIGVDDSHVYQNDPSADGTKAMLHAEFLDHWHDKDAEGNAYARYGIAFPAAGYKAVNCGIDMKSFDEAAATWRKWVQAYTEAEMEAAREVARKEYAALEHRYSRPTALTIVGTSLAGSVATIDTMSGEAMIPFVASAELYTMLRAAKTVTEFDVWLKQNEVNVPGTTSVTDRLDKLIALASRETPAPVVNVQVPEQPAPVVNIQTPEIIVNVPPPPAASVVVNVPPAKPLRRRVERDDEGNITNIIDE